MDGKTTSTQPTSNHIEKAHEPPRVPGQPGTVDHSGRANDHTKVRNPSEQTKY
jgi:hypothetical protein